MVVNKLRWSPVPPFSINAAGVLGGMPCLIKPSCKAGSDAIPI